MNTTAVEDAGTEPIEHTVGAAMAALDEFDGIPPACSDGYSEGSPCTIIV